MSSSHCLGKSRHSRQERVAGRRATASRLTNGNRGKTEEFHHRCCFMKQMNFDFLEIHSLIDAVNAQDYDRGTNDIG